MDPKLEAAYRDLLASCTEYLATTKAIDEELSSLDVDMDALNAVNNELETLISLEANQLSREQNLETGKRYMVAGPTKLRWMLDGEALPVFDKLDEQVAITYRRKLLQHYHPDRSTGDQQRFNMVNAAFATANVEVLGLLMLGIGSDMDQDDLLRYHGAAFRRLATVKAGFTFRILCLCRTGNRDKATSLVQQEIDKRTQLIRITILNRTKSKEAEHEEV